MAENEELDGLGDDAQRDQVRLAILERSGRISILRAGIELEPWLLEDLPRS